MTILLDGMLHTTKEKLTRRRRQTHLLGTIGKTLKITVGAKHHRGAIFHSKALQTFPDGGPIVQRSCSRCQGKIAIRILVNALEQRTAVGRWVIMVGAPFGGRCHVNVVDLRGKIQVPRQSLKLNAFFWWKWIAGIFTHGVDNDARRYDSKVDKLTSTD